MAAVKHKVQERHDLCAGHAVLHASLAVVPELGSLLDRLIVLPSCQTVVCYSGCQLWFQTSSSVSCALCISEASIVSTQAAYLAWFLMSCKVATVAVKTVDQDVHLCSAKLWYCMT